MFHFNVILTGFMGTGKTTVGRRLAERLGYGFVDTDALIEARQGRPISEIFATDGEHAFREMEHILARELAAQTRLVISTGGRMMLDPENAAALKKNGRIFTLTASPQEIARRVLQDGKSARPLLDVPDPERRIAALLKEREPGYGRFSQIDTEGKSADAVVDELMKRLR